MKKFALKKTLPLALLGLAGVAGLAYAATYLITLQPEITLSEGSNGHKPKLIRAADGTLIAVYGDSPAGALNVYDTKADKDRPARDIFVKVCTPDQDTAPAPRKTCNQESDWTYATTPFGGGNVSGSALKYSIKTRWQASGTTLAPYYGNTDKPNIKQNGPVLVLTWIGAFCPDGDLRDGIAPAETDTDPGFYPNPNQRAIRYVERDMRTIPFHCTWMAYSADSGLTWSEPKQLSNGERDAKQDSSFGTYQAPTARINVSWQEDPEGLQLGEADGPGDGASGANVTGGTDVWYTYFEVNATTEVPTYHLSPLTQGTARAFGYRVTDNWELEKKTGLSGQIVNVFDANGNPVDGNLVEKGNAGAARPNIGMVGTTTVLAWEETKGAEGLDSGKFIRYHSFPYNNPPQFAGDSASVPTSNVKSGCIISDPQRNARRVRFLTQSAAEATGVAAPAVPNRSGINIAIFWKEGEADKGGPSDIVIRRGMVDPDVATSIQSGLASSRMVPAVSAGCATSLYSEAIALTPTAGHARAENISSRASVLTSGTDGLADDTERNFTENALAHRGVLRGDDLWVGYNYTSNLYELWALINNYNFWIRKFTFDGTSNASGGSWGLPKNVTNVTDKRINVREPRIFGTPASNTAPGYCEGNDPATASDPAFCQNRNVIWLMWGSQENVYPSDPEGGDDLGVYATVSFDSGATYATPVRISEEQGSLFNDDESAFETQPQARPDGKRVYAVFNTESPTGSAARFRSADAAVQSTDGGGGGGGGCTTGNGGFDPTLLLLAGLGLAGVGLRRVQRARRR
ncbi:choice-of-anchor O protein [Azohydromonas sediminis]|uniref:choice-of-anchor O protein n=1 Tax=Azohydromonas sediminis TaxID=2259674 RepID=UPI001B356995|nr:choice-of-anchor O protein [Azohydromonas sediminis]